jgi:NTP pyrophosphatase (non-canonical NTP hydrolase)
MKTFNEYQQFTRSLAVYNESAWLHNIEKDAGKDGIRGMKWLYPAFALCEEAGEVAGKIAKFVRKSRLEDDYPKLREDVKKELGDVAFQLSETARQFGWTLQEVIDGNVEKLSDRKDRGVLVGEGDER